MQPYAQSQSNGQQGSKGPNHQAHPGRRSSGRSGGIRARIVDNGPTFSIDSAAVAIDMLHCTGIKAASLQKTDLSLVIRDWMTRTFSELGFSVKSMLGGASTLLNASSGTNFIFAIRGSVDAAGIIVIGGRSKIRDRIAAIEESGAALDFLSVESKSFKKNLRKIDTIFPIIIAEILASYYRGKGKTISELVGKLAANGKLEAFELSEGNDELMLKRFLVSVALGMTPQREWDGNLHHGWLYHCERER